PAPAAARRPPAWRGRPPAASAAPRPAGPGRESEAWMTPSGRFSPPAHDAPAARKRQAPLAGSSWPGIDWASWGVFSLTPFPRRLHDYQRGDPPAPWAMLMRRLSWPLVVASILPFLALARVSQPVVARPGVDPARAAPIKTLGVASCASMACHHGNGPRGCKG